MLITGEVLAIIYKDESSKFHILSVNHNGHIVTVTGNFNRIEEELVYDFHVKEIKHPIYGKQYQLEAYRLKLPSDIDKITSFLASGLFEGIGPTTAKRITEKFGVDSLEVMRKQPEKLRRVAGIGEATYRKIVKSFNSQLEAEEILFFLTSQGLTIKQAFKIYDVYGADTVDKVRENPYMLIRDVAGLGFKTVDQLARSVGFAEDAVARSEALCLFLVASESLNGNMFIDSLELLRQLRLHTPHDEAELREIISQLAIEGLLVIEQKDEMTRVYSREMYDTEIGILREIARLAAGDLANISFKGNVSELRLTDEQQAIVDRAFETPLFILSGGPGTGKTTLLKEWVCRIEQAGLSYALAAPTGRAASRMEEVIGRPASTIHRLLEYKFQEDTAFLFFHRNRENPLQSDVIFVDEASMLDAPLFFNLLKAIQTGSRLVLIGDVNQLPAVGPGNVLHDMLTSAVIDSGELTHIHRQAADSLIVRNAHAILKQTDIILNKKGKDFFYIKSDHRNMTLKRLTDLMSKRLPDFYQIDPMTDITVLTPLRGGVLGADNLNVVLQDILNKESERIFNRFKIGDRVMQNKNNYAIKWSKPRSAEEGEGIFNGDVGTVTKRSDSGLIVTFSDEKTALYSKEMAMDLVLAYAMTIHKSQGNEFDYVIIPVYSLPEVMRSRNLIYTAITRAKKHLSLIGQPRDLQRLIHADREITRNSSLSERLRGVFGE